MVDRRQLSLRIFTFFLLLLLSIAPLVLVSVVNLGNVLGQMEALEAEYEGSLLEQRLTAMEMRIHTYGALIRFVSQLPAVAEILGRGKSRPGSIAKERAYSRYTGVITRAFRKYPDILNIQIFNLQGKEYLYLKRRADQSFQVQTAADRFDDDQGYFRDLLAQDGEEVIITPVVLQPGSAQDDDRPRLLLRMHAQIRLHDEIIGLYVSDIDLGVLSLSFPDIHWVFSDGSHLSSQGRQGSALERFPGLKQVFASGRPAIIGEAPRMAWRPVYRGGGDGLSLWAGWEVRLEAVGSAWQRIYIGVTGAVIVAGLVVLFVAYGVSTSVQRFFARLLQFLEAILLHEHHPFRPVSTGFAEVDAFLDKVEVVMEDHEHLELEKQAALRAWEENMELLHVVTNAVQSAVVLVDDKDQLQFLNPAAETLFGYSQDELSGRPLLETLIPDGFRELADAELCNYGRSAEGPLPDRPLELMVRRKDGTEIPIELYIGRVHRDDSWWLVGSAIDISERKSREQQLLRLAETDPLTGVDNRRKFFMLAEQELKRCHRYDLPLFALMLDLDHFKTINDRFGHAVGDEILRQFADICIRNLRQSDLFGRMGGEEFAAIMTGIGRPEVLAIAERIRSAFTHVRVQDSGRTLDIDTSVSIGVARADPAADSVKAILKQADQALYAAKDQGRNRVVLDA